MKPEDEVTWRRALIRFRQQKDQFFGSDPHSPAAHSRYGPFSGLKYFEPNPSFIFEIKLQRILRPESVTMTTSKGTRQLFNRVGYFDLKIAGQPTRLFAYQSAEREDQNIFIPFRDATSGAESYGATRYIDLEVEHDDLYAIDFNLAYNPYCAYSDDYVCPLPPRENWLRVAIRAGEKKYHD
jgi:uncharacterized protein (DUF1684 family)